jgi:phenylacetate-CoA ligase
VTLDLHALAIRHIIGPLWAWWEGSDYLAHYRQLYRSQYDPPETIQARQWLALRALVRHAGDTVPFYRQRFGQARLSVGNLRSLADYQRLPILTKADIRASGRALLSEAYRPSRLHVKQTSGSTGVPLTVYVDENSLQHKRACTLRADEWSGWRWGQAVARLWSSGGGRGRLGALPSPGHSGEVYISQYT